MKYFFIFFVNDIKQSELRITIENETMTELNNSEMDNLMERMNAMENEIRILKNKVAISNDINKNLLHAFEFYFKHIGVSPNGAFAGDFEEEHNYDEYDSTCGRKLTISDLDVECETEYSDLSDNEEYPEPPKLVRQSNYPEYSCGIELKYGNGDLSVPECLKKINPLNLDDLVFNSSSEIKHYAEVCGSIIQESIED